MNCQCQFDAIWTCSRSWSEYDVYDRDKDRKALQVCMKGQTYDDNPTMKNCDKLLQQIWNFSNLPQWTTASFDLPPEGSALKVNNASTLQLKTKYVFGFKTI